MGKIEASTRATFQNIESQAVVRVTNRELRWLAHIQCHGPQPSTALIDLTADTHRCKDTALRALQRLRAGDLLSLPPQQRDIARADFHPYIYDITPLGRMQLEEAGLLEATSRPTGHWWHAYMVGALAAAIDRVAQKRGFTYVPPQTILRRQSASLGIGSGAGMIVPDHLFALNYGGSFRAFMLEVDRGTEPHTSKAARESLISKLKAYDALFRQDLPRRHYGLKCPLGLLFAFTSRVRAARVLQAVEAQFPHLRPSILLTVLDASDPLLLHAAAQVSQPWQRASGSPFDILQR
jgi:hypothetical protein